MKKHTVNQQESPLTKALQSVTEMDRLEPMEVDDLLDLEPELLNMLGLRVPTFH